MNFALTYIFGRFFFRVGDFFHHWYADGSRRLFHYFISFLENIDQGLAFRVTLKHISEPLYGDYSFIGRIIGFVFRSIRLIIGFFVYLFLGLLFLGVYLIWIFLPATLLALAIKPIY